MQIKIAAVLVIFNPDKEAIDRINQLAEQVDFLFVVDNSITNTHRIFSGNNISTINNYNKGGLAGALNIALHESKLQKFDYLFLFDQDTYIDSDFCEKMIDTSCAINNNEYGIYGPRHINSSTGFPVRLSIIKGILKSMWPSVNEGPIECNFLINSSTLLKLAIIPEKLFYDEKMGIDMIDVDFCLKLKNIGIKSLCLTNISVIHGIGNRTYGSWRLSPTHYTSDRKYLQSLNRVVIWKRYFKTNTAFVLIDIIIWVLDSIRTLLLEKKRIQKFNSIAKGFISGIFAN